jgi:hypothetical protein
MNRSRSIVSFPEFLVRFNADMNIIWHKEMMKPEKAQAHRN